jgi:hypothetical protein
MNYSPTIISIIENIILMLPALLVVAYVTVAERKTMASMQRRLGPNAVGYYGLLQAFADALKLILKEYVAPTQANLILFGLGSGQSGDLGPEKWGLRRILRCAKELDKKSTQKTMTCKRLIRSKSP